MKHESYHDTLRTNNTGFDTQKEATTRNQSEVLEQQTCHNKQRVQSGSTEGEVYPRDQ